MSGAARAAAARILVVEDEATVALALRSQLERLGYSVTGMAATAGAALAAADAQRPDLVLMDIGLADGGDGVETAQRIRARHDLPVVFLTGHSDVQLIQRAKLAEPYGYLTKPASEADLYATLEVALHGHRRRRLEQTLQTHYAGILQGMLDAVVCVDAAGVVLYANAAANRLLEVDDLIGAPVSRWLGEWNVGLADAGVRELALGAGRTAELLVSAVAIDGQTVYACVLRDVSARKHAEDALRQAHAKLNHMLQSAPAVIYCLALDERAPSGSYRLKYISPTVTKWLGYSAEECLSEPDWWANRIHPEDRVRVLARVREFGAQVTARQSDLFFNECLDQEYRFRCRDGTYRWVRDTLSAIRAAPTVPTEIVGSCVVENKEIEHAFRENEQKFAELVENIREVLWMSEVERNTPLYLSPAFDAIWGRSREDFYADPDLLLTTVHPEDRARFSAALDLRKYGKKQEVEYRIVRPDGAVRWIRCRGFPVYNEAGTLCRYAGIAEDFTEQKLSELELSASRDQLRELSRHLQSVREEEKARIARELHDELGGVMLGLKMDLFWLASKMPPSDERRQKVDSMLKQVESAVATTRRICTQLRPTILDHLGLAAAIQWQVREFENHTNIRCRVTLPEAEIRVGEECAIALFRILQEALTNVARHAEASQVDVDLVASAAHITLMIKDNGIGIARERINNPLSHGIRGMFERAYQLGGRVKLESAPGQGTLLAVRIPLSHSAIKGDDDD